MLSIAVLGSGGVGGFLAAALARAGEDVVVVARPASAELIAHAGIAIESVRLGRFVAHPDATTSLGTPVDVLLVATKATSLRAALARVQAEPALVVPLLNGLDHMKILRERFGSATGATSVAAGTIRVESDRPASVRSEADRPAPVRIVQSSPFLRVDLAADDPALSPRLGSLAAALRGAGIPSEIGSSEAQILWSKLVRLVALACTTTAADEPIGHIRTDPEWRAALIACIEEAAAVADAEGAEIDAADCLAELDQAHPELGSSMQRDLAAGREPELDAIAGSVLRAASRHGLKCPAVTRLATKIAERAGLVANLA